MGFLKRMSGNPLALLAFLVGGAVTGMIAPESHKGLAAIGAIYLSVMSMATLPFLLVAAFFGLRQVALLPNPGRRLAMLVSLALGFVLVFSILGVVVGVVSHTGNALSAHDRQYLGELIQKAEGEASNMDMEIHGAATGEPVEDGLKRTHFIPDNFFSVLVQGQLLNILVGVLIFAVAIVVHLNDRPSALMGVIEGIYRTLEGIISAANSMIPFLVFGIAASFVATMNPETLNALRGFLYSFLITCLFLCALVVYVIWRKTGLPLNEVLASLKTPGLIALTSNNPTASIPDTITALSTRLGFSRGIAEFVIPISSIFMRCGTALYFAILVVFVANLYGHSIQWWEFGVICLVSASAAFISAGHTGAASVAYAGFALQGLNLPVEAVLPLFLAIDLICEGPRSLVNVLLCCLLVALVSKGLPSEREEISSFSILRVNSQFAFTFSKSALVISFLCIILVSILIIIAGVGAGMR